MKKLLNGKVFLAALIIAAVLLCGSLIYILIARPAVTETNNDNPASAALTVISAPTGTPRTLPPTFNTHTSYTYTSTHAGSWRVWDRRLCTGGYGWRGLTNSNRTWAEL